MTSRRQQQMKLKFAVWMLCFEIRRGLRLDEILDWLSYNLKVMKL